MTNHLSINPSLAYCILRRNGAVKRVSFAAPIRGDNLHLRTLGEPVLSSLDELGLSNANLLRKIASLPIPGLRVTPQQQFSCPSFKPPVAPIPPTSPREPLAAIEAIRARFLPHYAGSRAWSLGKDLPQFERPSVGTDYIWVQEPITNVWWPYLVPQFVAESVLMLSTFADLAKISEPAHQWLAALCDVDVSEQLQYLKTPSLIDLKIPPLQLAALVSYYSELRGSGAMRLGDRDSPSRAWINNDGLSKMLLKQFSRYISKLAGARLSPYFSHFVSYRPNSSLPTHLDKNPGVFSVSIQLGYFDGQFVSENKWGFSVANAPSGTTQLFLPVIGQGVIFCGGLEAHSRAEIPYGHTSDVLLFHYHST